MPDMVMLVVDYDHLFLSLFGRKKSGSSGKLTRRQLSFATNVNKQVDEKLRLFCL